MDERIKSKVLAYVEKALTEQMPLHYRFQTPKWIREKIDAKAGDKVTVYGLPKNKYGIVSGKRVYNRDILMYDGKRWIVIDGGRK